MPTQYKILGQSYPSAATLTTAYTVPSATNTVVSTVAICNNSNTVSSYRIAIEPSAESVTENKHYIARDTQIQAYESQYITIGISLDAGDKVRVYSSNGMMSFNIFGSEIS